MAKQLNVSMGFQADTSQAKAAIAELNASLQKLQTTPTTLFDDVNLKKASQAAMELQGHLQKCVNTDTGKLDLSRFAQSMKSSNQDLEYFHRTLTSVGPTGQQAFLSLSKSIATADTATLKVNAKVKEFATTLKNTARWQFSSSMLHGFMGAVQSAYSYAQDLNESLNNIRIVTGASAAEMDKFAAKANKAAKALSTSTTAYTDAALIFYQQGLSDSQVEERTNVTIKMAHAAGESAEEVSSYMTAIWNNFDDGSKSLEYYGDVMARLGAETAASSAEIAEGLEKFAAIGETVGLSYEYATSALATVVDKTRASADTVGTAFKTIFARLQGLQLGETLEDGVDLNKYSKALKSVGIEVLSMNGEMKETDQILDELGAKWEKLTNAEQMALAQTVAGTRQYTQLMSLMNNYDDFKINVELAETSEGTLQEQADIYAESWEAAQERVGAAAEEIYGQLLNDDFFIDLLNGFEKALGGISNMIDGLGGLKGILMLISGIFLKSYAKEIPRVLSNIASNFGVMTGAAEKSARETQKLNQDLLALTQEQIPLDSDSDTTKSDFSSNKGMQAKVEAISLANQMTTELSQKQKQLSEDEIAQYQHRINIVSAIGEQLTKEGEAIDANAKQLEQKAQELSLEAKLKEGVADTAANRKKAQQDAKKALGTLKSQITQYQQIDRAQKNLGKQTEAWVKELGKMKNGSKQTKELSNSMLEYAKTLKKVSGDAAFEKLEKDLENAKGDTELMKQAWEEFEKAVKDGDASNTLDGLEQDIEKTREALAELGISGKELDKLEREFEEGAISAEEFAAKLRALKTASEQPLQHTVKMSEAIGTFGAHVMQTATLINGVKGLFSIWNNDDISTGEKVIQTLTSFGMLIPTVTALLSKDSREKLFNAAATVAKALADKTETGGMWAKMASYFGAAAGATTLQAAIWPLLLITLALAAAIMAVVGVVFLLVSAFNAIAASTPEGQLESARQATEAAGAAAEAAKEKYEELKTCIEDYEGAIDALEGLTKGTDEFTDAVIAANEAARELIDTYGLTNYTVDENGVIQIDKQELADKKDAAREEYEGAASAHTGAQKFENKKEDGVTYSNAANALKGSNTGVYDYETGYDYADGAITQANIETLLAKGNEHEKGLAGLFEGGEASIIEAMGWNPDELTTAQQGFVEAVMNSQTALMDCNNAINANAEANRALTKAQLAQNLSDEAEFQNSDYKSEILGAITGNEEKYNADSASKYDNMSEADMYKEYAELMGYTHDGIGTWLDGKEEFTSADGSETYKLTPEQVREQLKEASEQQAMEQDAIDLVGVVDRVMGNLGDNGSELLSAALTGDASTLDVSTLKDMDVTGIASQISEEDLKALGFASRDELEAALQQSKDSALEAWKSQYGENADEILEYFTGLSEDEKSLFLKVNTDVYETAAEIETEVERLKAEENVIKLQTQLEGVETAQGALSEDMSRDDYNTVKESIDWGNEEAGIIEFNEFLQMSYAQQEEYLDNLHQKTQQNLREGLEAERAAAVESLEIAKSKAEAAQAEIDKIMEDGVVSEAEREAYEEWQIEVQVNNEEVDRLEEQIKDCDAEIAIEVKLEGEENFKELLNDLEDMKGVNDSLVKDIKQVGSNYELTAEQARAWANIYPEMLENATVTSEGIVQLNADEANAFIEGKEAELIAAGEAEIAKLEMDKSALEAKKAKAQAEVDLAIAAATAETDVERDAALMKLEYGNALTEALIANDISETTSNQLAAAAMAGNEEEFARVAMEAAQDSAGNFNQAAYDSAMAIYSAMQSGSKNVDEFRKTCADAATQFKNIGSGVVTGGGNAVTGPTYSGSTGSYTAGSGNFSGHEFEYEGETISLDNFISNKTLEIEGYDAAIGEINTRIAEIRGSMAASLNTYTPGTQRNSDAYDDDGGGGGDKDKEKEIEELEEVAERYHEINREIEYYNSLLDENSKKKDRAFGKDKLKYMKEEQRLLEEKYKREKDLFDLQTAFLASDQQAIEDVFSGASFDKESGELTNYTAMLQQATDRLNAAKQTYNSSAQEDADKEALEKAEEQYDKEIALLEQYEETLDAWREQKANLQDLADQIYDAQLEELDYAIQMKIEVADDDLSYLQYLLERIENQAFSAAEAIANLGLQTQEYFNKHAAYEEGIKGIFGNHGLTDEDYEKWLAGDEATMEKIGNMSFTEDEVEKLREYRDGLMETNQALIETRQAVHDKMLSTFDEHNEKLDQGIAKLEHFKAMTESYKNIVDLVGKANIKDSDKAIGAINDAMVSQSKNIAEANIAKRDMIAADLEATKAAFAQQYDTISEEERKMWEDTIAQMEESLAEAEEAAMGSIEDWMQAINDKFVAEIEATMDRFSDTVAGKFKNLTELQDAFSRKQSESERYLEDYEKIYEFSKLNRDIEKSIDNTDNVRAKKELLALQEEINALEESGAEVSEYQIENLRKRYELKLAEQALEEAKEAKSQVRMTRDNEGNWGYVYTADESSVAEAEQSYEDKLFELQQHNADYINELQDSIINMQIEMKDKLAEIANDESLSIEERQAKMAEVQAYYQEQMDYYCSELDLALVNNKKLYEEDWTDYAEKTGYKIAKDEEYVDSFHETDLAVLTGFENMETYQENFNVASENLLLESEAAFDSWEVAMENALNAAGLSMENFADQVDKEMDKVKDDSQAVADKIKEDAGFMQGDYQEVINKIIEWENQYSQSIEAMIGESDRIIEKFNAVLALWGQVQTAANTPTPTPPEGGDGGGGGGGGNGGGAGGGEGGGGGGGGKPTWDRIVAAYNKINQGKWGNGISNRISRGAADGFTEAEVRGGQELINYTYPTHLKGMGYSREKAKQLMGYDTGGYTGAWGDQMGRLALLHQKELVLNQQDTENMLAAIEMVRQISSMIDLNAMSASQGLTSLLGYGKINDSRESLEQNVTIHAEFPGVSDRNEIQEAFNNLINAASQYAHRKI